MLMSTPNLFVPAPRTAYPASDQVPAHLWIPVWLRCADPLHAPRAGFARAKSLALVCHLGRSAGVLGRMSRTSAGAAMSEPSGGGIPEALRVRGAPPEQSRWRSFVTPAGATGGFLSGSAMPSPPRQSRSLRSLVCGRRGRSWPPRLNPAEAGFTPAGATGVWGAEQELR